MFDGTMTVITNPVRITIFAITIILSVLIANLGNSIISQDILVYQKAGLELVRGGNPYKLPKLSDYYNFDNRKFGKFDSKESKLQVWIPPSSLFIPLLLAFIPTKFLTVINFIMLVAGQFLSFLLAKELFKDRQTNYGSYSVIYFLFMIFPCYENFICWGSINSFQTVPWLLFLLSFIKKKDILAGIFLAFCSFKPQLIIIPAVYSLITGYQHISLKLILSTLFSCIILWGYPFIFNQNLINHFFELDRSIMNQHALYVTTLPRLIFNGDLAISIMSYFIIAVTLGFYSASKFVDTSRIMLVRSSLTLLLPGLIFFPYLWLHDYLIAAPVFVVVSRIIFMQVRSRSLDRMIKLLFAVIIFNALFFISVPFLSETIFTHSWIFSMALISVVFWKATYDSEDEFLKG